MAKIKGINNDLHTTINNDLQNSMINNDLQNTTINNDLQNTTQKIKE